MLSAHGGDRNTRDIRCGNGRNGERDSVSGHQKLVIDNSEIRVYDEARESVRTQARSDDRGAIQITRGAHVVELASRQERSIRGTILKHCGVSRYSRGGKQGTYRRRTAGRRRQQVDHDRAEVDETLQEIVQRNLVPARPQRQCSGTIRRALTGRED